MTRHEHRAGPPVAVTVYGRDDEPWPWKTKTPEDPGEYCFPPLAACITGAARLMLAMLERAVSDQAGTYAFCDTDSMAIVATERGGLVPCPGGEEHTGDGNDAIRALSWTQVDDIRARFATLNPYEPELVPELLELETENFADETQRQLWCYGISAKRYALYTRTDEGEPELLAYSGLDPAGRRGCRRRGRTRPRQGFRARSRAPAQSHRPAARGPRLDPASLEPHHPRSARPAHGTARMAEPTRHRTHQHHELPAAERGLRDDQRGQGLPGHD